MSAAGAPRTTASRMERLFTFFHTDGCELQAVQPLADELRARGLAVRFSEDLDEPVDVGIYCQHAVKPQARFAVIMLHDLAQRHDIWPAFWAHEPWHRFDIGLVPGSAWADRWQSQRDDGRAHPRLGVFEAGWPKSDLVWKSRDAFAEATTALRASLQLPHAQTVLYAPSWENHGKQDDFVRRLIDLPVNLLLKQAPWPPAYGWVLDNIAQMDALHRGIAPHVRVVDRDVSIMHCIGVSDLLVSDESSVLIEASLHGVPSVAVVDWPIPDCDPPRMASVPFDHVRKIGRADLRATVEEILADPAAATAQAHALRAAHFGTLGHSARLCADILLAGLRGETPPIVPLGGQADRQRLADLGQSRRAEDLIRAGRADVGVALLSTLAAEGTACWEVYNLLGVFAHRHGDTPTALHMLQLACAQPTATAAPWKNLAAVQAAGNLPAAALASYGRALRLAPDDAEAIDGLGDVLAGGRCLTPAIWHQLVADLRQR